MFYQMFYRFRPIDVWTLSLRVVPAPARARRLCELRHEVAVPLHSQAVTQTAGSLHGPSAGSDNSILFCAFYFVYKVADQF